MVSHFSHTLFCVIDGVRVVHSMVSERWGAEMLSCSAVQLAFYMYMWEVSGGRMSVGVLSLFVVLGRAWCSSCVGFMGAIGGGKCGRMVLDFFSCRVW